MNRRGFFGSLTALLLFPTMPMNAKKYCIRYTRFYVYDDHINDSVTFIYDINDKIRKFDSISEAKDFINNRINSANPNFFNNNRFGHKWISDNVLEVDTHVSPLHCFNRAYGRFSIEKCNENGSV